MRFLLKDVRLAFPSLWKASAPRGGGEPAFSASFILPKNHPQIASLKAAFKELAKEKHGAKWESILKAAELSDKTCLHDGDRKVDYEGFPGNFYVSARSKTKPTCFVTRDGSNVEITEAEGILYSGCYVNVSLELWAQDNDFGKRFNAQLRGVQFLRKGDAFAGGATPASADDFEPIDAPSEAAEDPLTAE